MMRLFNNQTGFQVLFIAGVLSAASHSLQAGTMGVSQLDSRIWNGLYLSGQFGGDWAHSRWNYSNANYFNTLGATLLGNRFNLNSSSYIAGGNLGYNYQAGNWIAGLEGSLSGTDLKKQINSPFFNTDQYNTDISGLGAVKARLGYSFDQWLVNVNGGWATADLALTLTDPTFGITAASGKQWTNGWTLGVGLDRKITPNFSAGISYDFSQINRNNNSLSCPLCGTGVGLGSPTVNGRLDIQAVMARASYYFNQ